MSTVFSIVVVSKNGKLVEQHKCDQRCYLQEATQKTCICEGVNKRVGKAKAIKNAFEYSQVWFQDWLDANRDRFDDGCEVRMYFQLPLPGLEYIPETSVL